MDFANDGAGPRKAPPRPGSRLMGLQPLDDGGVGHAAGLTHRLQPVAVAALLQRIDQRGHDACTAGAQRCPIAIAPPLTFVFARSAPVSWAQASARAPRPADRSITGGGKRYRTKTETHVYLHLSDQIERLIYYNFPVLISSPTFRIGIPVSG